MKAFTVSACALTLIIALVLFNSFFTAELIDDVLEKTENMSENSEVDEFYELSDYYMKRQNYLSLTVSHKDLSDIEDIIAELIGAAEADDKDGITIAKSRLISALSHIRRLSGINLDSIL